MKDKLAFKAASSTLKDALSGVGFGISASTAEELDYGTGKRFGTDCIGVLCCDLI
jgi:hypothetical protein